ncbi:MAG: MATE family efflux transporter [Burkholderiaceae bacterium]|nr:MATE family efflux transporter [Burkholderiaceae bacterium]
MTHPIPQRLTPPDISLRAIGKLAGPIYVANIAIMGGGTIDTIMAGHLGPEHLAAMALGIASMISVFMGLTGILQGLSPIAGHHFGAKRFHMIGYELTQCLWLAAILSVIGILILGNTEFWTGLAQVQGPVKDMATTYLSICVMGLPAALAGRAFIALNAAVSRPKITMYVSLGMLALKAPLNALFMYGWLGCPAMGGAGAAVSSSILSWLSLLCFIIVWKRDRFYDPMRAQRWYWPELKALWTHLRIGVPIGLSTFFEVSSFTLMAIFVSRFGAITVSAHQIVANITSICFMIPLSIGISASVLVSQCLGAGWPSVAEQATKRTLGLAVVVAGVVVTALYFARVPVISLYTGEAQVIQIAASLLIFGVIYHVFDAMQTVGCFALRGYRVTVAPMIIYGVFLWGVGLMGGYYMGFHGEGLHGPWGAFGFWGMTALGLILAGTVLAALALWTAHQRAKADKHVMPNP